MVDAVVIGAGVSGLMAAWRLRSAGWQVEVVEGRARLGGRAYTTVVDGRPVDMGATWVWDSEVHVHRTLAHLGVATVPSAPRGLDVYDDGTVQMGRLPASAVADRRIAGGMRSLVNALAAKAGDVRMGWTVAGIEPVVGGLEVTGSQGTLRGRHVVAALPPSLVAPLLPTPVPRLARVPVWMGRIAKVVALYDRPVWRERGLSGRAISRLGPLRELHDMSTPEGPALFGFAHRDDSERLEERATEQLVRLFGAPPSRFGVVRWWTEPLTTLNGFEDDALFAHPFLREPFLNGRLHLISCETSGVSPGHLDGAIERAETVSRTLLESA